MYNYVDGDPVNWIDLSGAAKICSRPLSGMPNNYMTDGYFDISLNHIHIFYDDGSNEGYGPDGIFTDENIS